MKYLWSWDRISIVVDKVILHPQSQYIPKFLHTFLIFCKSKEDAILFIVITMLYWSIHAKSAMISDLMFFSILFKFAICMLDEAMNMDLLSLLMGTITCFLERPFIVMLILGFNLPESLIILWMFSIFLVSRLGKFSLIFKILLTLGIDT